MSSLAIGGIIFVCIFGGAMLGTLVRSLLPDHHLSGDSKDVLKLSMGLIGTMAALVFSLLIASAKQSYDTRANEVMQASANVVVLDRLLRHYGTETQEIREMLRRTVAYAIDQLWSDERPFRQQQDAPPGADALYTRILELAPRTDAQRAIQGQAESLTATLGQTRWLLVGQQKTGMPAPFLVALVLWLTIIFGSFGLLVKRNTTVVGAFLLCAVCFSSAFVLILELSRPFEGMLQVSSAPLKAALVQMSR
jgi:hypothetical protein